MISSKTSFVCALVLMVSASLRAEDKRAEENNIIDSISQTATSLREKGLDKLAQAEARLKVLNADFKLLRAELMAKFKENILPGLQNIAKSGVEAKTEEATITPSAQVINTVAIVAEKAAPAKKSDLENKSLFIASSTIIVGAICWIGYNFWNASTKEKTADTETAQNC